LGKISKENFAAHSTKWSANNTRETGRGNKIFTEQMLWWCGWQWFSFVLVLVVVLDARTIFADADANADEGQARAASARNTHTKKKNILSQPGGFA
jgi:hypothetical protein